MLDDKISFSIRVCALCASFLITCVLTKELIQKLKDKRYNTAFKLIVSFELISIGLLMLTTWAAIYTFTRVTGIPAQWMLDSPVIPFYTMFMVSSAIVLLKALTLSSQKALVGACIVAASGVAAYVWIGFYL